MHAASPPGPGLRTPRVLVIGAGVGGLSAAGLLARAGLDVTVLERSAGPGGKACVRSVGAYALDAGPTVVTMRWVFERLFDALGTSLDAQLTLRPCEVLCRHAWGPSAADRLDLFADHAASVDAIGRFSGAAEARRYQAFCDETRAVHDALTPSFIAAQRPDPLTLTARMLGQGPTGWQGLRHLRPFQSLWQVLGRHFHDPRLRQLFARYATYCGSSPFDAPSTLRLIAHVEREAVWRIDGGLHGLAQALAKVAARQGAALRYGSHVASIDVAGGRVRGVQLADGQRLDAEVVVFNGDADALAQGLLGEDARRGVRAPPRPVARRSLSALTWHRVARVEGFALSHHTVFFGDPSNEGYRREFARLGEGALPDDPTVYVCAQDRHGDAPDDPPRTDPERLMVLVNAPAHQASSPLTEEAIERCERQTLRRLARCGLRIESDAGPTVRTTPAQFALAYPGSAGGLYGQASQGWRASFQRPTQRTRLPGLYRAGGSTHPGPGVPMASLSGQLAATQILADLASTWRSRPVAMPGGMSTR